MRASVLAAVLALAADDSGLRRDYWRGVLGTAAEPDKEGAEG
jgi:hypothetical protein